MPGRVTAHENTGGMTFKRQVHLEFMVKMAAGETDSHAVSFLTTKKSTFQKKMQQKCETTLKKVFYRYCYIKNIWIAKLVRVLSGNGIYTLNHHSHPGFKYSQLPIRQSIYPLCIQDRILPSIIHHIFMFVFILRYSQSMAN